MLKTKIEVLLDKIQLVFEEAGDKLTDVDKRLLRRYASQIVSAVDNELPAKQPYLSSAGENGLEPGISEAKKAAKADIGAKKPMAGENAPPVQLTRGRNEADSQNEAQKKEIEEKKEREEKEEVFGFLHPQDKDKAKREKNEDAFKDISRSLEAIKEANKKKIALLEEEDDEEEMEDAGDGASSLNDQFKDEQAVLIDQLKEQPIASLQLEIDLNDKFWFVSELFEGDAGAFGNLLKALDQASNLDNALSLLGEKIDLNNRGQAVQKLLRLVKRRFMND